MHSIDGADWLWMSFMMVFWLVVLGAVVYAAVRLAQRPPREGKQ
jgi:heme/copper-type cytochrome/quinol oxidase subunit 2